MKIISGETQKPEKPRRRVWMRKRSIAAYSAYIFKIEKFTDVIPDTVTVMRLVTDAHAQVCSEAARLSKFNRRRVITQRELHAAAVRALRDGRG